MTNADWFLQDWMTLLEKKQADLVRDLNWSRRKASDLFSGEQPYKRDSVNEIAAWLRIEPHELLMSPTRAMQLRQFEQAAVAIAASHTGTAELTMRPGEKRTSRGSAKSL